MCRERTFTEFMPSQAQGMIYMSSRLLYVVGFTGDESAEMQHKAEDILAKLGLFSRRGRGSVQLDYPEADPGEILAQTAAFNHNPYSGRRLNIRGEVYGVGNDWDNESIGSSNEGMTEDINDMGEGIVARTEERVRQGITAEVEATGARIENAAREGSIDGSRAAQSLNEEPIVISIAGERSARIQNMGILTLIP